MAGIILNKTISDGLVFYLDAANPKSFVSGSTIWNDLSAYASNGILTNGPTYNSSNGGSIVFDNSDDFINFGSSNISLPTNITLSAWIYQSSTSGYKNIITKEGTTGTDLDYGLTTSPNGNLYFWFHNGSYRIHESTTNTINSINTWYNVVSVFDDTNNTVKIYVNGILIYNQPEATSLLVHTNSKLFVGWRNSLLGGQAFGGRIAQTQIYSRALSTTEILQNYNATKKRYLT
jgi:hypothetical protein